MAPERPIAGMAIVASAVAEVLRNPRLSHRRAMIHPPRREQPARPFGRQKSSNVGPRTSRTTAVPVADPAKSRLLFPGSSFPRHERRIEIDKDLRRLFRSRSWPVSAAPADSNSRLGTSGEVIGPTEVWI